MSLINFSGIASGIDSSALIQAMLDQQRTARVNPIETKIRDLEDTNSAFDQLRELLDKLKEAADKFRALSGGGVSKLATSSDETKLTAAATNGAIDSSSTITISALARNGTHSFNDRYASSTTAINSSINNGAAAANRTVTYTIGSGADQETVAIELTSSTTAGDFVTAFNSSSTKATATLVNVGTSAAPSYAIVVNSNNTGTSKGSIAVNVGSEIQTAGSGAFTAASSNAATDATFTISGINGNITRSTNAVSDVLSGVTLNLQAAGSATVTVSDDPDTSTSNLQAFVDAYNEVVQFIAENDLITREESKNGEVKNIFGPLANTAIDENLLSSLRSAMSAAGISGQTVNIMADLGVTTQRDGTLAFDSEKFADALADDPTSVNSILENMAEELASVDGTIAQFTRFNGLIDEAANSNTQQITSFQQRLSDIEKQLDRERDELTARFARLESVMGTLQSQQSTLAGLLPK